MAIISDNAGLPIAVHVASTSPHEVTLAEATVSKYFVADEKPEHLVGDRAYDSDPLDIKLAVDYEVELIAPAQVQQQTSTKYARWSYSASLLQTK
jgi:hypothetical protein